MCSQKTSFDIHEADSYNSPRIQIALVSIISAHSRFSLANPTSAASNDRSVDERAKFCNHQEELDAVNVYASRRRRYDVVEPIKMKDEALSERFDRIPCLIVDNPICPRRPRELSWIYVRVACIFQRASAVCLRTIEHRCPLSAAVPFNFLKSCIHRNDRATVTPGKGYFHMVKRILPATSTDRSFPCETDHESSFRECNISPSSMMTLFKKLHR